MLRIILLIANAAASILLTCVFLGFFAVNRTDAIFYFVVYISLIVLFLLNVQFLIDPLLCFKRKRLEEEIKILEAKNKLKKLQSQGSNFLKEKTQAK